MKSPSKSLLIAVLLLTARVRAESTGELDALLGQSIVTTPSKGSETDTTAPATSTVISAEELRRYGVRSLDEAINYLSLGMATSSPTHAVEIGARGVLINGDYGNHVLLLVDGHAVNEPWNGTAYFERGAGVPFEMIDHIEVVLGPGSVLYGSEAMLGVINIVTKRAKDFSGFRLVGELDAAAPSQATGTPALADFGHGYRLAAGYGREFSLAGVPSELTLELDYYKNRGPHWHVGPQAYGNDYVTGLPKNFGPNASPGTWGGVIRRADTLEVPAAYVRFVRGDFRAAVRVSAFRRGTPFPDGVASSAADFDDPFNRELDRFVNVDLSQRFALSARTDLIARAYADLYDYQWYNRTSAAEDCPDGMLSGCDRHLHGGGRALGGELRAQVQWPILRASTLLGVDSRLRQVFDQRSITGLSLTAEAPTGSQRTDGFVAPYLAQTFSPTRWLDLNLGLRLDHDTRFGDKLSPRSALGITPWPGGRIKLIYSAAFRAPTAYELTYSDPNGQVAPRGLGPESERSLEASIEQRFGKHRLLFGVFRSWWEGLVGLVPVGQAELDAAIARGELAAGVSAAFRRSNLAHIDNYGLNAGYEGAAFGEHLRFGFNLTAAIARLDPGDGTSVQVLPVAPQTFGNARVAYDPGQQLPTVALALRFMDRRLGDRSYDGGFSPPPTAPPLWAMRLTLSGPLAPLPGLSYRIGGEYSWTKVEPYTIGATQYANANVTRAELAPTRRAQGFVGLEYAFDP